MIQPAAHASPTPNERIEEERSNPYTANASWREMIAARAAPSAAIPLPNAAPESVHSSPENTVTVKEEGDKAKEEEVGDAKEADDADEESDASKADYDRDEDEAATELDAVPDLRDVEANDEPPRP